MNSGYSNYIYLEIPKAFIDYRLVNRSIYLANRESVPVKEKRTILIDFILLDNSSNKVIFKDILYILALIYSLFSVSTAVKNTLRLEFEGDNYIIIFKNTSIRYTFKSPFYYTLYVIRPIA